MVQIFVFFVQKLCIRKFNKIQKLEAALQTGSQYDAMQGKRAHEHRNSYSCVSCVHALHLIVNWP